MESLELPLDIIWDGDQSPMALSPDYSDASAQQILIFENSFATELIPIEPNDDLIKPNQTIPEFSPEEFAQLLEIQQELLDDMDEGNQSNDQWLDQTIIPLDECAPVQDARIYPVKNTAQLLNEFNQVYDAVELTHLTPPETPPHTPPQTPLQVIYLNNDSKNQFYSQQPVTNYQLQLNQQYEQCKPDTKPMINNYAPAIQAQQFPSILEQAINLVQQTNQQEYTENYDEAMAEVEALVRSRAEDFADSSIDDDSSMCGSSSSCFSPRSEASSSITDDSDWTMKSGPAIATALKNKQAKQKRKPRINRRSPEDRQSRKKEQNKTAANRYRLKKKAEVEILLDEERDLIKRNDTLQSQFEEVDREVKFIKKLLRDLFKAKGLIQ